MGAFSSDFKETKGIAGRSGKMSQMPRGSATTENKQKQNNKQKRSSIDSVFGS